MPQPIWRKDLSLAAADPDRKWTSPAELRDFQQLRESGRLSFFREHPCKVCTKPCPTAKTFCSRACFETENPPALPAAKKEKP